MGEDERVCQAMSVLLLWQFTLSTDRLCVQSMPTEEKRMPKWEGGGREGRVSAAHDSGRTKVHHFYAFETDMAKRVDFPQSKYRPPSGASLGPHLWVLQVDLVVNVPVPRHASPSFPPASSSSSSVTTTTETPNTFPIAPFSSAYPRLPATVPCPLPSGRARLALRRDGIVARAGRWRSRRRPFLVPSSRITRRWDRVRRSNFFRGARLF